MKKTRILALLLAVLMVFALFAGCAKESGGSKEEKDEEVELVELDRGHYEVYDEDEELVAYLSVSSTEIAVYDEDGEDDGAYDYVYDEDEQVYLIDDEEAFTVEEDDDGLWLVTWEDEDRYLLEETDEIPGTEVGGTPSADTDAPATEAPAAGTDAPSEAEDETPAETPRYAELDPYGTYAAYQDGVLVGYMDMWDGAVDIYDGEDPDYETYEYEVEGDVYVIEGEGLVVMEFNGELRLSPADDTDDYVVLELIDYDDLPQSNTAETVGDAYSGDFINQLVGSYELVTIYADVPVEWLASATFAEESDGSVCTVSYATADSTTDVQIALGDPTELGVTTVEELAALLQEQVYSNAGDFADTVEEGWTEISGVEWFYMDWCLADFGIENLFMGAMVDGKAVVVVASYMGLPETVESVREILWASAYSMEIEW